MTDKKLQTLIDHIPSVAIDGIGPDQDALAQEIQQYEGQAIPLLLPLLKHPDGNIRQLADYTMGFIGGVNTSHLNALIAAPMGYSRIAIARIGTPQALTYAADDLRRSRSPDSFAAYGFEAVGKKSVPILCQLLRSASPTEQELSQAIATILGRMDEEAKQAALRPLLDIATNKRVLLANRQSAILALGKLGPIAKRSSPILGQLARQEPATFLESVKNALTSMNDPGPVPALIQRLKQDSNDPYKPRWDMRDLAELRSKAISAGPIIANYRNHPDRDVRLSSVRALGFIGFPKANPSLIRLLANEEDWQFVWAAAESLGRLHASEALGSLRNVAEQHWFPPVREAAQIAITHIRNKKPYFAPARHSYSDTPQYFASEFFRYQYAGSGKKLPPAPENHLNSKIDVPDGSLDGDDRGEWGGGLTFTDKDGSKQILTNMNTPIVAQVGSMILAASGLSHLGVNDGTLYRITRNAAGAWTATEWRRLPGAPAWAVVQESSNGPSLRVACYGGTVDVSLDGTMRFVE